MAFQPAVRQVLPTSRLFSKLENEVDPGQVEGTDLRIVKYPHPSLRADNAEVTKEELKDGSIAQLAKEMFLYMYEAEGVGLAAPQVGVNKRLMVYNQSGDKKRWLEEIVMVNPKIVEFSDATDVDFEGCLSFPDMGGDVERSKWIKVEALNLKGKKLKRKFTGWEAVSEKERVATVLQYWMLASVISLLCFALFSEAHFPTRIRSFGWCRLY